MMCGISDDSDHFFGDSNLAELKYAWTNKKCLVEAHLNNCVRVQTFFNTLLWYHVDN